MSDPLLQELMDQVRSRFYGKFRGVVTDVDASTMRIKASVPSVLPGGTTGWCMPCVPYAGPQVGFIMLPEVGSGVWIEFEGGDTSYPVWVGMYWHTGEIPSQASATVKNITLTDAQQNTVVLDSSGVTSTSGASTVAIGASGVNVNNGAFQVTS
jgi:hypothetical protein